MMIDAIKRMAIVGTGIMGTGIGIEFARFGRDVYLYDPSNDALDRAMTQAKEAFEIMVGAGLLQSVDAAAALERLHPATDFNQAVTDAQYVLEAVPEVPDLKREIFARLDTLCSPDTFLTSTSSFLKAGEIGARTSHPERVLVTHYYSPPHLMPLVEIIPGKDTLPEIVETVQRLLTGMHKKVVLLNADSPVYVGNRLQSAIAREIHALVDDGVDPQMVDAVTTFGFGRRMPFVGYFQKMDQVGLDGRLERYTAAGMPPWAPIVERVQRGELGMKTGKGFYEWTGDAAPRLNRRLQIALAAILKSDMDEGSI